MKILIDEMPKTVAQCVFSMYDCRQSPEYYICTIDRMRVPAHCPEYCVYLAKGAVDRELVFEADGTEEIAKAVHGDGKALRGSGSVSE